MGIQQWNTLKKRKKKFRENPVTGSSQNVNFTYFACEFSYVTYQKHIENRETLSRAKREDFQDHH